MKAQEASLDAEKANRKNVVRNDLVDLDDSLDEEMLAGVNMPLAEEMEKALRIRKLYESSPISATKDDVPSTINLKNRETIKTWLKQNIRGRYTNKDTGDDIRITKIGVNEVTVMIILQRL